MQSVRGAAALTLLLMTEASGAMTPADPAIAAAPPAEAAASVQAEFRVDEYRVLGNSVLAAPAIEKVLYPLLGEHRTATDVETARRALEALYHESGYATVFVDIPEQEVRDGLVRLRVTEGKLSAVRVMNARYFSARDIRAAVPAARVDEVPQLPALQSQITAFNAVTSDRALVPVLKAGSRPGAVDLTLKVDDQLPLHGSLELNNQYTADTTPLRLAASLSYNQFFGRPDILSIQYQTAPRATDEVKVFAGSYVARISDSGIRLAGFYVNSDSAVATVGSLTVLGRGHVYGSRLVIPLPAAATEFPVVHSFTLGADYKKFSESIQLDPTTSVMTPISYLNISAAYGGGYRQPSHQWSFTGTANFGVRGPNGRDEFDNKRFKAIPNYFYLRSDASYGITLPAGLTLTLRLAGQYSDGPIISNEQLALGGADSVRGYLEAEALGDRGLRETVQIGAPQLVLVGGKLRADSFVFIDAAQARIVDPLPSEQGSVGLRSWGAGIGISAWGHLQGNVVWAVPLLSVGSTNARDSRFLFSLRGGW